MSRIVPGMGNPKAKLMFIGEAPGETEEREGKPFVGAAGTVLDQLLADNGLKKDDCWVDNVIQTRPPANNFGVFYEDAQRNRPKPELVAGWARLRDTIDRIKPDVVVCLGAESLRAATTKLGVLNGDTPSYEDGLRGIDKYRGFPHRYKSGHHECNLIATYHPAYVARLWSAYPTAKLDLARVGEMLRLHGAKSPVPAHTLTYQPSFGQAMTYLDKLIAAKLPVAFDIEFANHMIDCIGFSDHDDHALTIPFAQDGGDGSYWSEGQETLLWNKIAELLASDVPKIGQNIAYEMFQLKTQRGIEIGNIMLDTMIAFNLLYPGQPKSLDYLATVYTWLPWWGEAPKVLGPARWRYNAMDCLVTRAITMPILDDLRRMGHEEFYYKLPHRLLGPLHRMSVRGIKVDREFRNRTRAQYRKRIDRLKRGVNKVLAPEDIAAAQAPIKSIKKDDRGIFNPGSDAQLRNLFYDVWKLKKVIEKGTKQPKVDESAIRKLADLDKGKHGRFFAYLLQFNSLDKIYNTYLEAEVGTDGRMRCSYNIAGTVTGRLSSSGAPDGTGTNLQNQPPFMRRMFTADDGCVMFQCDLKQAENRVVAYLANEPRMIQAFNEGADIHKRIAAMIFRKSERDITKQERQLGKKIGHASNYGMGVDRFRQVCWEEMHINLTREEAKRLQNQYFDAFPRIRMWQLEVQEQLNRTRTLTNPFGRKRYFFERWGPDLFKEAYAHGPQSTIVDVMNIGIIRLDEAGHDLLLQVHDSTNGNKHVDIPMESFAEKLKDCLEFEFKINGHNVVIPIEIAVGPNWADLKEWVPDAKRTVA